MCEELRYPAIAMMVEWLDEHPAHNELMDRLNYQQELDVDGTKLIMMAASERALSLGSSKLLAKISDKKKQITLYFCSSKLISAIIMHIYLSA